MLSRLQRWLRALARRGALDRELDEELRYHLERQVESNVAAGMGAEEARLAALREFGGVQQAKEECRSARGTRLIEELLQDESRHLESAPYPFGARTLLLDADLQNRAVAVRQHRIE